MLKVRSLANFDRSKKRKDRFKKSALTLNQLTKSKFMKIPTAKMRRFEELRQIIAVNVC